MEKNIFSHDYLLHKGCDLSSDIRIAKIRDKIAFVGECSFIRNIQVFITWDQKQTDPVIFG